MNKHIISLLVLFLLLSTSFVGVSNQRTKDSIDTDKSETPNDSGLMNSSWPMAGYDAQNTRRSPYSTGDNPGGERWRFCVNHSLYTYTPVIDSEGNLYLPTHHEGLISIYPNGTLRWVEELDNSVETFQPALDSDGTIYVGTFEHFYALNSNGTKKWTFPVTGQFLSDPIIGLDGAIYVETTTTLYAVNPNGTIKWNITFNPNPAVLSVDCLGNIYFVNNYYLYSLFPNGTIRWSFGSHKFMSAPTFSEDGTIYINDWTFTYALDQEGNIIWKVESPFGATPSIAPDGTLIATSCDSSKIVAIDPSDGHILWSYDIGSKGNAMSAASIDNDGTIYFTASNGDIYVYAMTPTGVFKWRTKLTCDYTYRIAAIGASPSIGKDGTVYVTTWFIGDDDWGYVHAIGGGKIQNIEDGYLHFFGKKVIKTLLRKTIVIGAFLLQMKFFHPERLMKVELLIDGEIIDTLNGPPYEKNLNTRLLGKHTLEIRGYYKDGVISSEKMNIFFLIV